MVRTKGTAGPLRSGYSTNTTAINTWVKTSHTHARLRMELRAEIILNISEAHKESTPAGKLVHGKHAETLVQKLRDYNVDLFGKGPAQHLVNGNVGFFDPIKKLKLNAGLSEKVRQQKSFDCKRRLPSIW